MSLNVLLLSDEMIKERSTVHGNMDPKLIYPDIKVAQDMYILPVIGTALYNRLQTAVNANDFTAIPNYKILLDQYIVDALMNFTLAEMPLSSFQFWNKGVLRKTGLDTETPSMSELFDLANHYRKRAEFYGNRLRLYLIENSNLFPEYLQPGNGIDTVNPDLKGFSMNIYLGPDNGYCDNNPGGFTRKPYSDA